MNFINTLPYISNPIDEFSDFKFVSWEKEIYPKLVGKSSKDETDFFVNLIINHHAKDIIDLGIGGGTLLSNIFSLLQTKKYKISNIQANEVEVEFILQAQKLFFEKKQNILIHRSNRLDLPEATPSYNHLFDFGFLTGNSLTYIGGGSREYTKKAQQSIVNKFSKLIKKGGYMFIDTRDYDYIKSLMYYPPQEIMKLYSFDYTTIYHGAGKEIIVFPAYISETVVVLHYYDKKRKYRSKLDLYPIYHHDMIDILNQEFTIKKIYYDLSETRKDKCILRQYLIKKK